MAEIVIFFGIFALILSSIIDERGTYPLSYLGMAGFSGYLLIFGSNRLMLLPVFVIGIWGIIFRGKKTVKRRFRQAGRDRRIETT